jgi:hypothetical protein
MPENKLSLEELNYKNFRTKEVAKLTIIDYLAFYNLTPHA